ncbi:MAG: AF1514 family protein [Pseudomonadota bacterium]|nr:AF1514 family protein [Pseudomonadota bacterium]
MRNVQVDYQGAALNYQSASLLAKGVARENQMQEPTIMSWHKHGIQVMPPYFEGANPDTWWEKYGEGNGGKLEISVGDEYQFVLMDARGYETLGEMPLRNLTDEQGNQFLCYTPVLGKQSNRPTPEACSQLDGWFADQY